MTSGDVAPGRRRWLVLPAVGVIVAVAVAYWNSVRVPFLFDDETSIAGNASIRQLCAWAVLHPPHALGETVGGRPLLNLSFALNWALSGANPWSYHLLNIGLHAANALLLFGVMRRTLARAQLVREPFAPAALVALLWAVHPLQTAAITYLSQRAEALCACCYLLTLYAFARALESKRPKTWLAISVGGCALGMAAKEVMVGAPLVILLYDRTFVVATVREAWRRRWPYYLALVATWILLGCLLASTGGRGGSAGFGHGTSPWQYALRQCWALTHYLGLALWPFPLVFDYGPEPPPRLLQVLPQALLLAGLLVATAWALRRRRPGGFAGACFFLILAPTSSFVPIADPVFEHRMYLPLAVVIAFGVVASLRLFRRREVVRVALACGAVSVALTIARNRDYDDAITIWRDTTQKRPGNARAFGNLGTQLVLRHRPADAVPYFAEAVRLAPTDVVAQHNLGNALELTGRHAEAIEHYRVALQLDPNNRNAHHALALALSASGDFAGALPHFQASLRLAPDVASAHLDFARALLRANRLAEGEQELNATLRLDPGSAEAHENLANLQLLTRRADQAIPHLEAALRLGPETAARRAALGACLALTNRFPEARVELERALVLDPQNVFARRTLDAVTAQQTR